jgi:nucleotide-binding universal stress UspA family protein
VSLRDGGLPLLAVRHILVDIDAFAPRHPALDQAIDLAVRCGGRVTIVDVMEDVPRGAREYLTPDLETALVEDRRDRLERAAARFARRKLDVAIDVLRGRPAEAIVRYVARHSVDLVVRSHARDLQPRRASFGSVDMQLLRKCPCAVWIVGVDEKSRPKRVLAAIHPDRDDAIEQALNRRIIGAARTVAELQRGSLTVLAAWVPYGEGLLRSHMSDAELRESVRAARDAARAELDEFLADLEGLGSRTAIEFVRGEPEVVIPRYAKKHDIDLVVMGTVARSGLLGLLMGNTAEQMLQRLRCSVFALKPEGFVTPVVS